jgi:hypothetical protein
LETIENYRCEPELILTAATSGHGIDIHYKGYVWIGGNSGIQRLSSVGTPAPPASGNGKRGSQLAAKSRLHSLGHINGNFFNSIDPERPWLPLLKLGMLAVLT